MSISRRDAIALSGTTLAGVSLGLVGADQLVLDGAVAGLPAAEQLGDLDGRVRHYRSCQVVHGQFSVRELR